jgi:hypothetical protein
MTRAVATSGNAFHLAPNGELGSKPARGRQARRTKTKSRLKYAAVPSEELYKFRF